MTAATDLLNPGGAGFTESRSASRLFWERFREDKAALIATAVIGLLILIAFFGGPLFARITGHPDTEQYQSIMQDEFGLPKGPNSQFWFGADGEGRDLLVRTMYGARTSLIVGVVASGIAVLIGLVVGLVAGYFRGFVDTVLSRLGDVMLAMPQLLISIGIVAACNSNKNGCVAGLVQPGIVLVICIIVIFSWPYIARIVRGFTLSIREKEFVEASRSLGAGDFRIIFREIVPNLIGPIIVYTTLLIPNNILFEAALSYLGVGINPPQASWGEMLAEATPIFATAWWFFLFPGLALLLTVLAFNLLGDGIRDALDPKAA